MLGTVHTGRGVDAVPVVFVLDGEDVVIPIDAVKPKAGQRLQRMRNLDADARAVLLVDRYDDDWSKLWWVRVHGDAIEAPPTTEQRERRGDVPRLRHAGGVTSVIVLTPNRVTGWGGRRRPPTRGAADRVRRWLPVRSAHATRRVRHQLRVDLRPEPPPSRWLGAPEELGFDSIWAGEHVVVPSPHVPPSPMEPEDPILDPLVHLGFVAAATERLLLATGIIILPQQNPSSSPSRLRPSTCCRPGVSSSASAPATSSPR